ncbi:MAG TPA: IS256 family transposase [Gemmatimonadaceae bacterium]|nr:IS256 family transposase [Gemmatimonadaceae bacterium]
MAFDEKTRTPVALEQAPAPEDALRTMVATLVQETLRTEFEQFVGAAPYERTPERRGYRNGSYPRAFKTRVGALTLSVPRDRAGLFRPSLFAKYERSEQALVLAMIEMYFHGVSTRKVNAIVEQLCGTSISASEVSALTRKLDASLTAWRERRLTDTPYLALVVDAHVEHVRREGHVRGTAALWVVGVTPDGYREHLGVWMGPSESEASWASVFQDLVERGLHGVTYVVSDEHVGLVAALHRYFPEAVHQRCQVHYQRNALSKVTSERLQLLTRQGLRDAWGAPTREEAALRLARLITELRPDAPRLADWLADTHEATLPCYVLERDDVREKLRSTNSLERHHNEVRPRTRVIRIFPHEASLLRLLTALAIEQNDRWRTKHWLVEPTFIPAEEPMRRSA